MIEKTGTLIEKNNKNGLSHKAVIYNIHFTVYPLANAEVQ